MEKLTNGIINGMAARDNESYDDREKYRNGWDNIFNKKKKPPAKKVSRKK